MKKLFEVIFLEEVIDFLQSIDNKHSNKILFNIRKLQIEISFELFKKLQDEIWEFRTLYQKSHYRLLAFWDKNEKENTLVISTHGFIKKSKKTPITEIEKAKQLRIRYFEDKKKLNK